MDELGRTLPSMENSKGLKQLPQYKRLEKKENTAIKMTISVLTARSTKATKTARVILGNLS